MSVLASRPTAPATALGARRFGAELRAVESRRAVLVLACVLGLQTADLGTVGALGGELEARLWGRAEAIRTVARTLAIGAAPLLFGWIAGQWGSGGAGLRWTLLIMVAPLLLAGMMLRGAVRTYPRDVATALDSEAGGGDGR